MKWKQGSPAGGPEGHKNHKGGSVVFTESAQAHSRYMRHTPWVCTSAPQLSNWIRKRCPILRHPSPWGWTTGADYWYCHRDPGNSDWTPSIPQRWKLRPLGLAAEVQMSLLHLGPGCLSTAHLPTLAYYNFLFSMNSALPGKVEALHGTQEAHVLTEFQNSPFLPFQLISH